ncbi:hypothetical protein [Dyadobacter luticola]|uniref:Uncharacterized protein n=1 Tax=Dyadobacter luticola TaxID=1979387 RepID=A0A5R9L0Z8_9BACT|nr:hypothetical protein [Dyadobacter luticola]TLV02078.1 hypothetical protein FEN17_00050 [Dyadobacter luticola]
MKKTANAPEVKVADGAKNQVRPKTLFQQMLEDKKVLSDHIRGKVTESDLNARGIKLVKPI